MPHLELSLFGPIKCTVADGAPVQFAYDKVQALLAYLATEPDRPHRREVLAGLLWPNQEDPAARHNLNQALWTLRRSVDDRAMVEPMLRSSRDTIQLSPSADCDVDIHRFSRLLEQVGEHVHRSEGGCRSCSDWLIEATELYRGPFLSQLSLADTPEFEEWVVIRREHFHEMFVGALERLTDQLEYRGETQRAIAYLRRLLQVDPWHENSHRRLMRLLARSGQRPAALAHFERVRTILERDLDADVEQETVDLKNKIERGAFESTRAEVIETLHRNPGSRLPAQINQLVGREQALSELGSVIASGQHRLITLIGPGGIGKTSLALQLAHDQEKTFRDGVCYVPLAGTVSAESLIQVISDARALPSYGNSDPREQLLTHLREQDLLLVLDNFEHLLAGVGLVADILAETRDIQLVVTSRERLRLYGEYVFQVAALDIPSILDNPSEIGRAGAVQLFIRSAERANSSFRARAADFPAIIRICELVGGMPLGIELAAAWTPLVTCQEIASEIERSIDFLTSSFRDVPDRHRSVRAAFDHSWRLLADHERDAFVRLSVFRGGFQKHAAEQVTGTTLPVLLAMMSKSIISRSSLGRFEIHELLRQYGVAKLKEQPDMDEDARRAHARYYADFLLERELRLKGSRYTEALADLAQETENVRAAWGWALHRKEIEVLCTLVQNWLAYEVMGRYQELRSLHTQAIAVLEESESRDAELGLALALARRASSLVRIGEPTGTEAILQQSNEILLRHGKDDQVGLNLNFLAMKAHMEEDHLNERRILKESIRLARQGGDRWTTAYSLNDLGLVECQLGDLDQAEQLMTESLEIFNEIGDARGQGFALNNLGIVNCRRNRYDESTRLHEASLRKRRSLNNFWGAAQSLTQLGVVARLVGDYQESGARLREALRIAAELRAYPLLMEVLVEIADLLRAIGDRERAVTIMSDVATHPSSSPSVKANLERMRGSVGDGQIALLLDVSTSDPNTRLDHAIAIALDDHPKRPDAFHVSAVSSARNLVR